MITVGSRVRVKDAIDKNMIGRYGYLKKIFQYGYYDYVVDLDYDIDIEIENSCEYLFELTDLEEII